MAERADLCERVSSNITNLKIEAAELELRIASMTDKAKQVHEAFLKASFEAGAARSANAPVTPFPPGLVPAAVDGFVTGVSVADAIRKSSEVARLQAKANSLKREYEQLQIDIREAERQLTSKRSLIQDQRRDFNGLRCFDLGFSHEVLND